MTVSVLTWSAPALDSNANATFNTGALTVSTGSYMHIFITYDNSSSSAITSVTDTQGLSWTNTQAILDTADSQKYAEYVSTTTTSSTSITITVNLDIQAVFNGIAVKEIGGASGWDSPNGKAGQYQAAPTTTTDATTSTNTGTLSTQPALVSGFCANSGNAAVPAAGTGFTSNGTGMAIAGAATCRGESKRVTATTAVAATFTAAANTAHVTTAVIFKESGGGGGGQITAIGGTNTSSISAVGGVTKTSGFTAIGGLTV